MIILKTMIDHLKLLSVIFNVIIGSGIIIYTLQIYLRYQYPFLKYLTIHITLTNLGLLILFIVKYIDLNISAPPSSVTEEILNAVGYIFADILIISFGLISFKIVLNLFEMNYPPKIDRMLFIGTIVFIACYLLKYFLPENGYSSKIHLFIYENITGIFLLVEFLVLIYLAVKSKTIGDRERSKMARWFAFLYIFRYVWILIVLPMPQPFRILLFGVGINLLPFIWVHYFFLNYANGLLQVTGIGAAVEEIMTNFQITRREEEVIRLILDGKSNQTIADELFVSLKTVKNHIYSIYQKIGIKSRYELIRLITLRHD